MLIRLPPDPAGSNRSVTSAEAWAGAARGVLRERAGIDVATMTTRRHLGMARLVMSDITDGGPLS